MKIKYSPSKNAFFVDNSSSMMPDDAVAVSNKTHQAMMNGQAQGMSISPGEDGQPMLVAPVEASTHPDESPK